MIRRLGRSPGEDGSALIIALAFMLLFGLFIAALLSQAFTNAKTARVAKSRTEKLFAADGGLEFGLVRARNTTDNACPTEAAGEQTLTSSLSVNAKQVTVKCRNLGGEAATAGGWPAPASQQWSVVANDLTTVGAGGPLHVSGGDIRADNLALGTPLTVNGGDFVQGGGSCTPVSPPLLTPIIAPYLRSCTEAAVPDVPHVLPSPAPTGHAIATPRPCGGNPWKILHPGKYTALSPLDIGTHNYLESGVYYFENYPVSFAQQVVVGGMPVSPDSSELNALCPGITDPTTGPDRGVIIILGGTSSITLNNVVVPGVVQTSFELFTRAPAGDSSTRGISIVTVPTSGSGYTAWTGGPVLNVLSSSVAVAVHGLVYARPGAVTPGAVTVFGQCKPPLRGGVVASQLTLKAGTCATGGPLLAVQTRGRRTLLLTSTAATPAAPGDSAVTEQAVVKIANDPVRTATVRSWRAL